MSTILSFTWAISLLLLFQLLYGLCMQPYILEPYDLDSDIHFLFLHTFWLASCLLYTFLWLSIELL